MQSLWNDDEARAAGDDDLALRVYTSRLLGRRDDLVMHGGGNTSVKSTRVNLFGEREDILFVKGSGWDLKTIAAAGFSPCRLDVLRRLGTLPTMTDTQMARELRASMVDPSAPSPSVEAILHALIPLKYVDHTHTDAVVAISNTPDGESLLRGLWGERVLVLPYVMPGFVLAKQVYEATRNLDWARLEGIVLLHHGLFTFDDDARTSYERMIALVAEAEALLEHRGAPTAVALAPQETVLSTEDCIALSRVRRAVGRLAGRPMLARFRGDTRSAGFARRADVADIATRGPVTPDHTLHTKRVPAILGDDPLSGIARFADDYAAYFERHADGALTRLDTAPRWAVWQDRGCIAFGADAKRSGIVADIVEHTIAAIQWGEALGGWRALPEADVFAVEYWELEQAKLKAPAQRPAFEGKVALVTGAASGIGKACVERFLAAGAAVVALDINPSITTLFASPAVRGITCDITDESAIGRAVREGAGEFGGIDVLVANAGFFPASATLENLDPASLDRSLRVNFTGHVALLRACIPFLREGFDPAVVIVASKNVPAPGPGAGAYSVAKAALTQMARVAALELGADGIRVNTLHPNAVFDTAIWTDEVLAKRAASYGLSIDEYKTNNVLKTEVRSADVAELALALAGPAFAKTTGAQVPVDGGNERVI